MDATRRSTSWTAARYSAALATIEAPRPVRAVAATLRSRLADAFLDRVDRTTARRALPTMGALRLADPTVAGAEAERVGALVARHGVPNGPAYPE